LASITRRTSCPESTGSLGNLNLHGGNEGLARHTLLNFRLRRAFEKQFYCLFKFSSRVNTAVRLCFMVKSTARLTRLNKVDVPGFASKISLVSRTSLENEVSGQKVKSQDKPLALAPRRATG
jgi:hypothetical protein